MVNTPSRAVSAIDVLHREQRAEQQPCAEEQEHGGGNLSRRPASDRMRPPRPVEVRDSDATASASDSRVACHDGARPNRTPTTSAVTSAEDDHAEIERQRDGGRQQLFGNQHGRHLKDGGADGKPQRSSENAEEDAFRQQLADQADARCADRRPDRQFAFAAGGAGEQQVRDVCAADQQDDADDADEQQGRGAQLAADERLVQRLDRDAAAFVGGGEVLGEPVGDHRKVGAGRFNRRRRVSSARSL